MRTHLEFRSAKLAGGANSINPEILGANLAAFLDRHFRSAGYDGGFVEEDWGWMVPLSSEPFKTWLGCASYEDDGEWLVFIDPSKPYVRRLFSKTDTRPVVEKNSKPARKVCQGRRWGYGLALVVRRRIRKKVT